MLRIKEIIKEKGMTSQQVADKMGITQSSLSRALNNNTTVEMLQKIADALEVDIADFFVKSSGAIHLIINDKPHTFHSVEELKKYVPKLREQAKRVGILDLALAKIAFFKAFQCVRPSIISDSSNILIQEGRYLPTELQLERNHRTYTPVSIELDNGVTCITGANMGGKTITLKMVGLILWMAHMALFVPVESAKISLREFLMVSIGDDQDADLGLSTFGAEIVNVAKSIDASSGKGVILIDELARGTNPKEGYALSMSIVETLKNKPTMTLITTHFDGLADQENVKHLQVVGLENVDFDNLKHDIEGKPKYMDRLNELMDYRLKEIHTTQDVPKDAVHIAQLMGLDIETLDRAIIILDSLQEREV